MERHIPIGKWQIANQNNQVNVFAKRKGRVLTTGQFARLAYISSERVAEDQSY